MGDAGWMKSLHNPVVSAKTVQINYDRREYEYLTSYSTIIIELGIPFSSQSSSSTRVSLGASPNLSSLRFYYVRAPTVGCRHHLIQDPGRNSTRTPDSRNSNDK